MAFETEIKKQRQETKQQFDDLRKLIAGRGIISQWIKQPIACAMLNVKPRQLRNIRKHLDKNLNIIGTIGWRKGKGRSVEYFKPDVEKYLSHIVIQ